MDPGSTERRHQLRLAGYRVDALHELMPQLRQGNDDLDAILAARDQSIACRSPALLRASTHIHALIA